MLYISAVGCVAEKTVEVFVLLEPRARNHTTLDWQERLAVSARESIQFEIPCLSKERLQNAGISNWMLKLPRARLYWMKSSMAEASFIGGLLIRSWRLPEVNASVLLPSGLKSAAIAPASIPSGSIVVR